MSDANRIITKDARIPQPLCDLFLIAGMAARKAALEFQGGLIDTRERGEELCEAMGRAAYIEIARAGGALVQELDPKPIDIQDRPTASAAECKMLGVPPNWDGKARPKATRKPRGG